MSEIGNIANRLSIEYDKLLAENERLRAENDKLQQRLKGIGVEEYYTLQRQYGEVSRRFG